jgi:hypothetical protein
MKHTALLLLSLVCLQSLAQDRGLRSEGREFYLGFLQPSFQRVTAIARQHNVYALISSHDENQVMVSYANGSPEVYHIAPRSTYSVPLVASNMLHDTVGDKVQSSLCHITAKRPISVQYYSIGPNSGGSYLALPISAWGRKYVVASYNDNPGYGAHHNQSYASSTDLASGIFMVLAAYDGTIVTITPTAQTAGGHAGVNQGPGANGTPKPYIVTLGKGECYFVRSSSSAKLNQDDISGSIISATKPVAVIAGQEDAIVGDGSVDEGFPMDHRDFMIEQLVATEFWDNTAYISIPYKETEGAVINGVGENYRVYVSDANVPATVDVQVSATTKMDMVPHTFAQPAELQNRTAPMSFSSQGSSRFGVIQYDLRAQGSSAPYPAPSMNTLVPKAQWSRAYSCYVPMHPYYKPQAAFEEFFLTCIADASLFDSIMVSINSSVRRPISNTLKTTERVWNKGTIPGFPDLKAIVYKIPVAITIDAIAPSTFMMYTFGDRATDFDHDLGGAFDGDDYMFSYANPLGMTLFDKDVPNSLLLEIDTLCSGGWRICATDDQESGGIRYVSLIDDPGGYIYTQQGKQYDNVSILPPDDAQRLGEITLSGKDKSYCFTIGINDPSKSAYAPVIIYDKAGNYRVLELRQSPRELSIRPDVFSDADLFHGAEIGVELCTTIVVRNNHSSPIPYRIDSLSISTSSFSVKALHPTLPAILQPGDSLEFDLCFRATDTLLHRDTIHLTGNCLDLRLPLAASTVRPILVASDITFGNVYVGKTVCKLVTLKNTGQASFTMQSGSIVQSGAEFAFDSISFARFPFTMAPGATETLKVCYTPDTVLTHSAWISWQTDITPPFAAEQKAITNLSGQGLEQPGAVEERSAAVYIHIRPNPARDKVTVEVELTEASEVSIEIYDLLGREVLAKSFDDRAGMNMLELPLPKLADGMYYLRVNIGGIVKTFPLEIKK